MSKPSSKKSVIEKNNNPLFKEFVSSAFRTGLKDTISLMSNAEVSFEKTEIRMDWKTEGQISGVINFETTEFRGSLYIHFSGSALIKICNQMTGEKYTEVCPEVIDCIGEISNMAYGVAKGKLDYLKLNFTLSLPHATETKELVRLPHTPHLAIPFNIYDQRCLLEVSLFRK